MVAAVKQFVTVQRGGIIRLRSKELRAGDEAEVIVLVSEKPKVHNSHIQKAAAPKKGRISKERNARMTKQDIGDVAWAKRILAEPGPNIRWEQIKANRGR